uniref:Tripartite motif-containing protein 2 n=1 Tax=Magallana gigas TaxID=29159 RepID=A0A8W8IN84_MAGGI
MSRSRVPGYREGLKVYQTFTCPRTDSAWTSASLRMNCNVGGDQPFNHYYCIPNAERTHFVEFCYDRASMKTEKGNCWELGGMGYLNQVDCTNFVKGCPDYTYLSEQVYKKDIDLESNALIPQSEENKETTKPTLKSQSVDIRELDINPVNVKGHISHLFLSATGDIWASNDRGKVGFIDPSGIDKTLIETCSTCTGHFTRATVDDEEGEHIYWVHNEEKFVKRDDKIETRTGIWEPISIIYSADDKLFHVGLVKDNDAKITRYYTNWTEKDDIHRNTAEENIFQYPAYLVKNTNGDLCVSDNNKRVVVVDKNNKFRFMYPRHDQNGFTPYGISTDSKGCILIVDSSSSSIHIINQKGDFQRYIKMSEHLREPRGLCIDESGKCCVGTYGTILVYKYTSDDTQTTKTATTESENENSKITI